MRIRLTSTHSIAVGGTVLAICVVLGACQRERWSVGEGFRAPNGGRGRGTG